MKRHGPAREICQEFYKRKADLERAAKEDTTYPIFQCGAVIRNGKCPTCGRRGNVREVLHAKRERLARGD